MTREKKLETINRYAVDLNADRLETLFQMAQWLYVREVCESEDEEKARRENKKALIHKDQSRNPRENQPSKNRRNKRA